MKKPRKYSKKEKLKFEVKEWKFAYVQLSKIFNKLLKELDKYEKEP